MVIRQANMRLQPWLAGDGSLLTWIPVNAFEILYKAEAF